ncbi:MAG: outer membrane lipoprotein-sorting protein [Bacteroidota bacterium]
MKKLTILAIALLFTVGNISAQDVTVDDIIDGYLENTGGKDNWRALKGTKMTAKVNQGGLEIPVEIVVMADGRTYTKISIQGNEIYQGVFDGENLWSTNFQSMKPEKSDQETTDNFKLNLNDFPDSFLDYKDKGYTVELMGTETIDGTETYKVKLVKEPIKVNGEEKEDVTFYYFDTESFVPIAQDTEIKQGPQAGVIQRITQSDYDEVEGLYFPFSISQGIKDGPSAPIKMETIEVNPEVDESVFKYPGE